MRIRLAGILLTFLLPISGFALAQTPPEFRSFKILHVMSYYSPWRWTDDQFEGFRVGLGSDVKAEFRVIQLDTGRNSAQEEKERRAQAARRLVDEWAPDLVYTTDDDAVELVTRHYYNAQTPFVFSGMNKTPEQHGISSARNVTGVLEREHFAESLRLFKAISPKARRFHILSDTAAFWQPSIARMEHLAQAMPDVEVVAVTKSKTYAEFQRLVVTNPEAADAFILVGIFTFKDDKGKDVHYQELQRWLATNSRVPEISFWIDRIHWGVMAGVTVSARQQGMSAGKLARAILLEGRSPGSLPIESSSKGTPAINLARARALGLIPRSTELLTSEVVRSYEWETR